MKSTLLLQTSTLIFFAGAILLSNGCKAPEQQTEPKTEMGSKRLVARVYNSNFPDGHDTYNGMGVASDGRIYYVLSSARLDMAGRMYVYNPSTNKIDMVGDLTEACGEKGLRAIPQGKSHVNFIESDGKLYFATHVGYYTIRDGMETYPVPPEGYKPYPGGHFLSYDLKTRKFEVYGVAPKREGIITFAMDTQRKRMYGITWPTGYFIRYDMATKDMKDFGGFSELGEAGKGPTYRTICRSMTIDPDDGSVYMTVSDGTILRYRYDKDAVEKVTGDDLRKDYFGQYDFNSPGNMGYNWRQTFWRPSDKIIYGVHGNSGYLFRFNPRDERVEVMERITSEPSKRSGMFDEFSYGYLGFALGPDGDTIHYLTGGPVYINGQRVKGKTHSAAGESKGVEDLHLVTYNISNGKYADNGAIFFPNGERPSYVNSIAVGHDGTVYSLGRITENGKTRTDLFSVAGPLKR